MDMDGSIGTIKTPIRGRGDCALGIARSDQTHLGANITHLSEGLIVFPISKRSLVKVETTLTAQY